ncbi:MAG: preprotein translocase subunit SecG [Parcubacteria group bacterium 21-54-25]|nr:MAG: preprotein translocase subunit SecG [Parcubacteria group bacterium 21-54-25]HQU07574.1 preprotein translocase subunit SecG [Candidatus Paceibacterota bacterium]
MLSSQAQMDGLTILPYAEIVLSLLIILAIVLQQRGASLGGAFGGDNFASTFYKRRGAELFLFRATIALSVLLVGTAIASFLLQGA